MPEPVLAICRFAVHHRGYMIHRPHADSPAKQQFLKEVQTSKTTQEKVPEAEGQQAKQVLGDGGFTMQSANSHWFENQLHNPAYRYILPCMHA